MQIEVNRDQCVGAGQCVLTAPETFDQDDDGLVLLLNDTPEDVGAAREAARLCPARAITVHE